MAKKPEANFIQRIHRKVVPAVHKQAMGGTLCNGTPDFYYEGPHGSNRLWVEYKWYPSKPKTIDLCNIKKKPCLSSLQQRWLNRALLNKQPVLVIAGYPGGCIILENGTWNAIGLPIEAVDYPIESAIEVINGLGKSKRNSRGVKFPSEDALSCLES